MQTAERTKAKESDVKCMMLIAACQTVMALLYGIFVGRKATESVWVVIYLLLAGYHCVEAYVLNNFLAAIRTEFVAGERLTSGAPGSGPPWTGVQMQEFPSYPQQTPAMY